MLGLKGRGLSDGAALGKLRLGEIKQSDDNVILWFGRLTSEHAVSLNKSKISALLCEENAEHSHGVIIAKALGIPIIVGVPKPDENLDGCEAAVDGKSGKVTLCPNKEAKAQILKKQADMDKYNAFLQDLKGKPSVTSEGRKVEVLSSLNSFGELHSVIKNDAEGIGLLRSELMFFEETEPPCEELQFQAYKLAAEKMQGKKVVVRAFDFSKDKRPAYLKQCENLHRATEFCLENPEFFKTQLRAILRSSVFGNVQILLPMIQSAEQINTVHKMITDVKAELARKDVAFNNGIKVGAMLENAASIENSSVLSGYCDFFSIGTNDPARAGCNENSILTMVGKAVDVAHKSGIPVCVCGEMAGNLNFTKRLINIGADSFCVSPTEILPLRGKIRSI